MSDEMQQLLDLSMEDEDIEMVVRCVMTEKKVGSVKELFERYPDEAFELHEQCMMIVEDTAKVGDFEHELERPVLRREDLL